MGYATTLPMLYALYCVAGIGAAFVYSGSIGSALKWFKDRRGLASGIMAAGFGGGTALFIPFITLDASRRAAISRVHRDRHLAGSGDRGRRAVPAASPRPRPAQRPRPSPASSQLGQRHFTTLEMLRTPQFYVMYAMFVLMATGGLLVTANAGPIAKSWGFSAAALTLAATLSPLANGASRIFWGWASDRIGRENTMIIAFVLQAICLLLVLAVGQQSRGAGSRSRSCSSTSPGARSTRCSRRRPPTTSAPATPRRTTRCSTPPKGVASIIGGWVGALLFERSGSWAMGFYGSAVMALVAAGIAIGLRTARLAERAREVAVPGAVLAK